MIRRTHKITPEQDEKIGELARNMGVDKEEIVQLALENGLAATEQIWIGLGKPRGLFAYVKALKEFEERRIRKAR